MNDLKELYIDSTDIQNKCMGKEYTNKSFKLKKQARRLTIISDENNAIVDFRHDEAKGSRRGKMLILRLVTKY